jgi:hypothetical protein
MDVELPLFPLEIAAIRKSFWPAEIAAFRKLHSGKRIFKTNPQLFILMLPNFAELRASPGFEKFVFI